MTAVGQPARGTDVLLRDGSTVRLHPLGRADEPELLALYQRLDERSRGFRFFGGAVDLRTSVHRLAAADPGRFGLLARRISDGEVVGHGEYVVMGDGCAEVAFTVDPEVQGLGLGTELLTHLAEAAERCGIARFRAETLPSNRRMIAMAEDSGFPVRERAGGDTVVLEMPTALWPRAMARFEAGRRHTEPCGSPPVCERTRGAWIRA